MARVTHVFAWEALDSRGKPTVACEVSTREGHTGRAVVPSGASTGTYEALELRDMDGGVAGAVANVNGPLRDAVLGLDASDVRGVDAALRAADGTPNLSKLGANAVLAVSVASAIAGAGREPLYATLGGRPSIPMPMVNIVSGGAHAAGAVDIQDVLVVPTGASCFRDAIDIARAVRAEAARRTGSVLVADEGGIGERFSSNREAIAVVADAIEHVGEPAGIAIDVAATQFYRSGSYELRAEGRTVDATELVDELSSWCDEFPVVSIEDPVADTHRVGWKIATERLGGRVQLIGDDLLVTDLARLNDAIEHGLANAVLVKPNQCGTLSGAADVVARAKEAGYATIVSARSGETEDDWLADLAVGWDAGQIKVGSTTRSERTAKWNRLLRIEAEGVGFAGWPPGSKDARSS